MLRVLGIFFGFQAMAWGFFFNGDESEYLIYNQWKVAHVKNEGHLKPAEDDFLLSAIEFHKGGMYLRTYKNGHTEQGKWRFLKDQNEIVLDNGKYRENYQLEVDRTFLKLKKKENGTERYAISYKLSPLNKL